MLTYCFGLFLFLLASDRYGMVTGVKIMRDMATGASKGFGFVNFATLDQANAAMQALNNYAWEGKRLRISFKTAK